jgi:Ca-activated chloride channel family protein
MKLLMMASICIQLFSLPTQAAPATTGKPAPVSQAKPVQATIRSTVTNAPIDDSFVPKSTSSANATPTPYILDLPIDKNSMLGTIEFSDEPLDQGLKPRVIILLDSSGSMGQVLDKAKSKMYYAKKLFGNYLADQWREKAEVGMVVYGSRRKHDCSDTYMPFPVGERNLSKIDQAIKKLSPLGMTPIADSLQIAIDQLKNYPGPKRVMIFTDGEETCGGDSCEILEKAIQEKVFDLEMFVTGIGLKEKSKDLDKLRCLGKTFGAPDSKALEKALNDINNNINGKGDGKNPSSNHIAGNNLYVDAPLPKAPVKLFSLGPNGEKTLVQQFVAQYGAKVPPGEYMAEVALDPVYTFKKFKIPAKKVVKLKVTGVGYVQVTFFNNLLDVEIINRDKKVLQSFESDNWVPVKSGEYDIRISGEPFFEHYEKKYKIIPGKKHEIAVDDVGVVQVDYPKAVGIHVFDGNEKEIGSYISNFPFVLKTGAYRFYVNDNCNIEGITVRKEKTVQRLQCLPKTK